MEIKLYITIEIENEDQYKEIINDPESVISDKFDYQIIELEIK